MAVPDDAQRVLDQFGDLFGDFFGAGDWRARSPDVHLRLAVTLAEAGNGAERRVPLTTATRCAACEGTGGEPRATRVPCTACEGRGAMRRTHGAFVLQATCEQCGGAGGTWTAPCEDCDGRGQNVATGDVVVRIPPGVDTGHVLRLAGRGNDLGDGRGHVLLTIDVSPHAVLTRDGADLRARVRRTAEEAARGGDVEVGWLDGVARVSLPPHAVHGTEVRLAGWGAVPLGSTPAPPPSSARGDLVVTVVTRDEERDPHDVLGLPRTATQEDARAAYRRLAIAHREDATRLAEIGAAYARIATGADGGAPPPPAATSAAPPPARTLALVVAVAVVALAVVVLLLR